MTQKIQAKSRNYLAFDKGFSTILLFGIIAISILLVFYLIPVFYMFLTIFLDGNEIVQNFSFLISDPRVSNAFVFSLWQGILSTIISLIIGFPIAYLFSHYRFKGDNFLKSILTIPFLLPPIVVVQGFITVYAENGIVNSFIQNYLPFISTFDLYSVNGIILAHVFYNTPIIIRMISVSWEKLDRKPLEVAETLGATKIRRFLRLELPQLKYSILSACLLVFLYCFTSLAVVLSFGGLQVRTMEVQIFRFAKSLPYIDFALASALAFIQLIFLLLFIILYYLLTKKSVIQEKVGLFPKKSINLRKKENLIIIFYLFTFSIFVILPMLGVFFNSFFDRLGNYTFENFLILFSNTYDATIQTSFARLLLNTLFIALMAMMFSLIMSMGLIVVLRYWKPIQRWNEKEKSLDWFQLILLLPLASSGLLVALGLYSIFKSTIFYSDLDIVIIIMAHSIAALPITSRIINTGFYNLNRDLSQVGATLGANKLKILLKIEIPLVIKAIFVASLFSFAISLGEFGSTLFINPQEFTTLGIAIYRLLGTQNLGLSSAMSTILMVSCIIAFILIDKISEKESVF
jgi:thiamine transport system permease protein